jgi:hypothetical protein
MWRSRGPGPGLQDWESTGVGLLFCVAAVFVLYTNPSDGIAWAALAFFALCALVGATSLLHKLRRGRSRPRASTWSRVCPFAPPGPTCWCSALG